MAAHRRLVSRAVPGRDASAHPEPERFIEHFAGTDATVSDYLLSEVLAGQPGICASSCSDVGRGHGLR